MMRETACVCACCVELRVLCITARVVCIHVCAKESVTSVCTTVIITVSVAYQLIVL